MENLKTVLIRHLGRDATMRSIRAMRPGYRWQGFLFDDGTPIRSTGARCTEVSLDKLAKNANSVVEAVAYGMLEVCYPDGSVIPMRGLLHLLEKLVPDFDKVISEDVKNAVMAMLPHHSDEAPTTALNPTPVAVKVPEEETTPAGGASTEEPKPMVEDKPVEEPKPEEPKSEEPVVATEPVTEEVPAAETTETSAPTKRRKGR